MTDYDTLKAMLKKVKKIMEGVSNGEGHGPKLGCKWIAWEDCEFECTYWFNAEGELIDLMWSTY